ncbi:hypothetical protein FRB94_011499 [Tulasnella sp. JGI-2019a]|nr:hypothetical protein FRB94_011499 [Tulasnella sp. JGI-2019a]KAG9025935.1 hypothetical protein FRB95_009620 [Tulasnella sp. JGI-2019a]
MPNTQQRVGFESTKKITFLNYTSTPIRRLECKFTKPQITQAQYESIDWSISPRLAPPVLSQGASTISNDDMEALRERLLPAFHLDLSKMAKAGLLPKPVAHSFPDLNLHGRPTTAPIQVGNTPAIHENIYRKILPNIYYNYRICEFLFEYGLLQVHPDGMVDLVPGIDDDRARVLLAALDKKAFQKMWCRLPVYNNEANRPDLALASWLFCVPGELAKQAGQAARSTGSVLFTYIPDWVMPEDDGLDQLRTMDDLQTEDPDWFAGIHATCQDAGAHHLIIYTGVNVVIGIFNADFTGIQFSRPEHVDARRDGYGKGIGENGIERDPCENMNTCLVQVVTQVMMDAAHSLNATTPGFAATPYVFKFNKAPLAWNDGRLALPHTSEEKTRHAMRFSRRPALPRAYPTAREIAAMIKADEEATAEKKQQEEEAAAAAAAAEEVEEGIEWASARSVASEGSRPPAPVLATRKRPRSEEPEFRPSRSGSLRHRPIAPLPRARFVVRASPALSRSASSALRRMGVERTRSLDSDLASGDHRPTKRVRITTAENAGITPTPETAPVAGPSTPRKADVRNAKLANVIESKKRREIKSKAASKRRAMGEIQPGCEDQVMTDEEKSDAEKVDDLIVIEVEQAIEPVAAAPAAALELAAESPKMVVAKLASRATVVAKVNTWISAGLRYVLRSRSISAKAAVESKEDEPSGASLAKAGSHLSMRN